MEHRDTVILKKVLSELRVAQEMLGSSSFADFESNEMLKRAICMTVINFGELVKNLSDDCRRANRAIPWKEIAGFRDIAAHKYQTLRMEDVYETVTADFPVLYDQLENIISL